MYDRYTFARRNAGALVYDLARRYAGLKSLRIINWISTITIIVNTIWRVISKHNAQSLSKLHNKKINNLNIHEYQQLNLLSSQLLIWFGQYNIFLVISKVHIFIKTGAQFSLK